MTSDSTAITQKSLSKRALAIIVALLMALGTVFVTTLPAHADSNVTIDDVFLQNDTFADGTRQELHVQWSIPEAATPTVSLSLELPEFMRGYSDTFDMVDANGNAVGECVVTADAINCTVDDTFIINNPYGVSGEFWFDVQTELKNKEETQHTFDFGGFTQDVTIEANRNWCTTDCEFTGLRASKWGTYYNSDDTIIWSVRIPAPATGIEPGKAITVTDQLDDSIFELVTTDGYPRVRESSAIGYDDWDREVAYYKTKDAGEVSWSDDNLTASFTSAQVDYPGGVSEGQTLTDGSFYIVQWEVRVKDEGKAGKYSNDATYTIEGEDDGDMSGSATRYSGGATVVGTNFGRFQVAKELTGDTALNPTFTVDYEAFDDTVDPNVAIDSGSFEIKSGQSFVSDEYFKGTRIVLGEIKPTDPDNVIWEDPKFLDADGNEITELTFSAENGNLGQVTEIRLVNEANLIDSTITARKVVENPDSVTTGVNDFRVTVTRQPNIEKGITPLIGGQLLLPANGDVVSVDYPAGTGYGFFENFVPSPAGTTWADPVYTVNGVEYTEGEFVDLPLDGSIDLTVTNTITQNLGGFAVTKSVSGEGESLVPEGTEFVVNYSYTSVNGFDAGEGQVTVAAGARSLPIEDIPAGATVTLDEVRPVNPLGGTWGEPQFDVAEFTAINDQIIEISLDNPISWNDGDFSIVKTVEGDAADMVPADEAFVVDYTYTLPAELGIDPNTGEGQLTVQNDGTATTSDPLPYGTEVTLAEQTPAPIAGATWTGSAFSEQTFTIGDETTLAVTLTNSIERDLGSFSIVKSLSGTGESLVADDTVFTVNYSYPAGDGFEAGEGTVEVSADGTPVVVDGIPAGAVVTLNEATPADITGGTWSAPNFVDGNIVNVEKDATSEVELENTIELNTGYLAIEKRIDGTGAALATPDEVYTVSYSYPAGEGYEAGEGTLEIQADGEPVSTEPLPYGATVALSELTPVPVEGAAWTGAEFSTSSVVVGDGTTAEVILTNTLTEDVPEPTPTPTVTPDPTETPTPTPDPTETPEPSPSPTTDPTPVPTPTDDPEPTETPAPTPTPTDDPEPTPTPTDDPEPTETPEPTVTPEPTPTEDPTPDPSPAPAPEPTSDPEPTPTTEPSAAPSDDPDDSKLNPTGQDTTPLIAGAAFALLLAGAGIEIARRRSAARNS